MSFRSICVLAFMVVILGTLFCYKGLSKTSKCTIGIIQTASHPALDQAREGFMAEIRRELQNVDFVVQNAEGSLSQAQGIAESFHTHKNINAIFAIGTPAVQAAAKAEKQKPIFIAAVSDPESLGIIHPGTNICGTTDQVNTDSQAELILNLVPTVQTIAILYNPGENNSCIMVKKMQRSLEQRGLKNVTIGVHAESEIAQAVAAAARKGDVILIPNDNLLAGAMTLVAQEALKKKCPLFVSDIALVEKGAVAAQGAEYSDLGKNTAEMARQVLSLGKTPEDVGIVHPTNPKTILNKRVLDHLQISNNLERSVRRNPGPSEAGQDELSQLGRKASLDASHPQTDEESPPLQGEVLQGTGHVQ